MSRHSYSRRRACIIRGANELKAVNYPARLPRDETKRAELRNGAAAFSS